MAGATGLHQFLQRGMNLHTYMGDTARATLLSKEKGNATPTVCVQAVRATTSPRSIYAVHTAYSAPTQMHYMQKLTLNLPTASTAFKAVNVRIGPTYFLAPSSSSSNSGNSLSVPTTRRQSAGICQIAQVPSD